MLAPNVKFIQKAIIFHPHDSQRFLALWRSEQDDALPGNWDLPGGSVAYGEDHLMALRREILEESALTVLEITLVTLISSLVPERKMYYILAGHSCQAQSSDVVLSQEHIAYRWLTAAAFLSLPSSDFLQTLTREVYQL